MEILNKTYHFNPWFSFITLCILTVVFGLFAESFLVAMVFGFGALIAYPNKKFQTWLEEKKQQAIKLSASLFYAGIFFAVLAVVIWGIGKIFSGVTNIGRYEGQSAKEWFYEYEYEAARHDDLKDCVEENSMYYGFEDYDELQAQLDEIGRCT